MALQTKRGNNRFLLLYASQTGQAKAIAEEIADTAPNYGLKADLFCISLTDKRFCIEKETCAVFIVSTTGDGEAPDTAAKFVRRLTRHTLKKTYLENLNYALIALGDSNYIKFCLFGRLFEKRLKALSAKSFYPTGYGDDAFGIETAVDPWIQNLWPALQKQLKLKFVSNTEFEIPEKITNIANQCNLTNMSVIEQSSHHCSGDCTIMCSLASMLKDFNPEISQVPKLPMPSIVLQFDDKSSEIDTTFVPNESLLVSKSSPLAKVSLISARKLTSGSDVKRTLELTFEFQDKSVLYQPGDSFGFICPNSNQEVQYLIERLDLHQNADLPARILLHTSCTNKKKLPKHIPPCLTLRDILLHCVEIRSVPKKILLRALAEYTKDSKEKLCLLLLCSVSGSSFYADFIRKPSISVLDILMTFKSCHPPIEKLIEHLPFLKPRFYSIASSPLENELQFKIVFNVLKFAKGDGRLMEREGVCTGWLNHLSTKFLTDTSISNITNEISSLSLYSELSCFVYKRKNEHFRLPNDLKCPIIMVGPGTGVAPFMGFLSHREKMMQSDPVKEFGESWLFYGCRYKENDFLYKEELQKLLDSKALNHLIVSFSRETSSEKTYRYVHENIQKFAEEINSLINDGGKIYVCGDAKYMAHDVQQALIEVFVTCRGLRETEAKCFIEKLQKHHRYINDVWI